MQSIKERYASCFYEVDMCLLKGAFRLTIRTMRIYKVDGINRLHTLSAQKYGRVKAV